MWQKALENAKLIASTLMVLAALITGSWTLVTNTFVTKTEASNQYKKFDRESSYNKAFRLESIIAKLELLKTKRPLTAQEDKFLKRLKKDLNYVDEHIYKLETEF